MTFSIFYWKVKEANAKKKEIWNFLWSRRRPRWRIGSHKSVAREIKFALQLNFNLNYEAKIFCRRSKEFFGDKINERKN